MSSDFNYYWIIHSRVEVELSWEYGLLYFVDLKHCDASAGSRADSLLKQLYDTKKQS